MALGPESSPTISAGYDAYIIVLPAKAQCQDLDDKETGR